MYSKMNNNGVATTIMKNVKTPPPPPISEQHQRLNEIEAKDVNLSSFKVKKELNPKFWPNGKLNSRVRLRLMDIADDFVKELAVNWVKPKDVIFTGSAANYNWSCGFLLPDSVRMRHRSDVLNCKAHGLGSQSSPIFLPLPSREGERG